MKNFYVFFRTLTTSDTLTQKTQKHRFSRPAIKQLKPLTFGLLVFVLLCSSATFLHSQTTWTWTGAGADDLWHTAANWDEGTVPDLSDVANSAVIPIGFTAVNNGIITNRGTLTNAGTLTNSGTIDNYGFLNNNLGGTLNNVGTINNNFDGIINNSGTLTNNLGGTVER